MKRFFALTSSLLAVCAILSAQDTAGRIVVPSRNSSRPRVVKVSTVNSGIAVKTYGGNEVIIETGEGRRSQRPPERTPDGLRRLDLPPRGFSVEEEDNVITIHPGINGPALEITVPVNTSLQLRSVHGPIRVDGVHGDVEASCTNGGLELTNVTGTIVADTTNGSIKASMDRVDPSKPISFSSTNGTIDVALPADLKANLKMRSFNGSIWTDYEVRLSGGQPISTTGGGANGRYQVKVDRTLYGTVNGGGVEASFSTLNGRIMIRKK
jgi:Putative adhesin